MNSRTKPRKQLRIRSRDTAVLDVSANRDLQTIDFAKVTNERRRIEQRLGRVLPGSVSRIDDGTIHQCGNIGRGSATAVADDDRVGSHGVQRARRVFESLAFLDRKTELLDDIVRGRRPRPPG